jgi:hypothetical protein
LSEPKLNNAVKTHRSLGLKLLLPLLFSGVLLSLLGGVEHTAMDTDTIAKTHAAAGSDDGRGADFERSAC